MKQLTRIASLILMLTASTAVYADPWRDESGRHGAREFKEEYRQGNCKVEREYKKDGEYKEKRECKAARGAAGRHGGREFKEEYSDGNCKVEREYKKDGEYKEKRECKGGRHAQRHPRPASAERLYDAAGHRYEYVQPAPGVRVDVRVRD